MWHPAQSPLPAPTRDTPAVQSSTFAAGAHSTRRQRRTNSGYRRSLFHEPLHPSSASQRRGCGALGDSGHTPKAGIKGTPRRGKGFRRYPLRQDGRWPGVGRRKEEEEGGSSHLPAAVPAGWEVAVGHQGLGSVRSKQPAVCNTQPRRHCSQVGSQGVLQDPHQWPLVLASCSTPPRPWCSPAVGVPPAAGAAGQFFCNTLPKPWCSLTGQWVEAGGAPPVQEGLRGLGQGPARAPGVAGSSGSSRQPRQH